MSKETRDKLVKILGVEIEKESKRIIHNDDNRDTLNFDNLYKMYSILASIKLQEQADMSKQATEVMTHALDNVDLSKFNFSDALKGFIK